MAAFAEVPAAAVFARDTLQKTGINHGWPSADLAAMIADVDALEESTQHWYSYDTQEVADFWAELAEVYLTSWKSRYANLVNMDKIGAWLSGSIDATISAEESVQAQSFSAVAYDTATLTASDIAALPADIVTAATPSTKTLWILGGLAALFVFVKLK